MPELARNTISRHIDVYICGECGVAEAMEVAVNRILPLSAWYAPYEILKGIPGLKCENHIPQKGNAYSLCDNPACGKSKECNIAVHMADRGGYSKYDK